MKHWRVWGAAILAILVLIVVVQNTDRVETKILWLSFSMPRAVLLFTTLMIGVVLGLFLRLRLTAGSGTD